MPFAEGTPTETITIGGWTYTIAWTWAAKRRTQESLTARGKAETATQQESVATALWAAMEKDVRDSLSVEDLEELIHPGNEEMVATKLGALMIRSEPDPDPNAKPRAGMSPPTLGTQSSSQNSGRLESTISA